MNPKTFLRFPVLIFVIVLGSGIFAPVALALEKVYYIHTDHLGSVTQVTDESGNVVSQHTYYPYGSTRGLSENAPTEHQYTGQISDTDQTGLYYYNARYYNPQIAKFTQADSEEGPNRYLYVGNNPVKYNDLSGDSRCIPGTLFYMHNCRDDSGESESVSSVTATSTPEPFCYDYSDYPNNCATPAPYYTHLPTRTPGPVSPAKTPVPRSKLNPRLDLSSLMSGRVEGARNQILDFVHQTDPSGKPPQFSTLVAGNPNPQITGTYGVSLARLPMEYRMNPNEYQNKYGPYAPAISLAVGNSAIRVPYSDHIIDRGKGLQAMVIYAGNNSIAINYGTGGGTRGYTVYITNINIAKGITAGTALKISQVIGFAQNGTIYIAITDNGDWWDPRWNFDFWNYIHIK